MGLGPPLFTLLKFMHDQNLFRDITSVAEIGSQEYDTKVAHYDGFLERFLGSVGASVPASRDPETGRYKAPAHELFRRLGCEYVSFDIDGRFGSIPFDLNFDTLKEEYRGWAGLTTNLGTTEHVFNQVGCFKVIHDLTRQGGLMLHALPLHNNINHGLFSYSPCLFEALAEANGYELLGSWMTCKPDHHRLPPSRAPYPSARTLLLVLLQRLSDAEFVLPLQLSNPMQVHEQLEDRYKVTERRAAGAASRVRYDGVIDIDLDTFTSMLVTDYQPPPAKPPKSSAKQAGDKPPKSKP